MEGEQHKYSDSAPRYLPMLIAKYRYWFSISLKFIVSNLSIMLKVRLRRREKRRAPSADRMGSGCGEALAWRSGFWGGACYRTMRCWGTTVPGLVTEPSLWCPVSTFVGWEMGNGYWAIILVAAFSGRPFIWSHKVLFSFFLLAHSSILQFVCTLPAYPFIPVYPPSHVGFMFMFIQDNLYHISLFICIHKTIPTRPYTRLT